MKNLAVLVINDPIFLQLHDFDVWNGDFFLKSAEKVEKTDAVQRVQQGDAMIGNHLHVGRVKFTGESDMRAR